MCGIAGSTRTNAEILSAMVQRLSHRGPDANGEWLDESSEAGLAHTRLAVIDLSPAGHQPMVSPCGRWVIAFNGEIYNYRELRQELENAGESFVSHSDTEVLLRLLARQGLDALHRLVGMFAFGLWDRERRELTLARDRYGVKPLVYGHLPDGGLAFASEINALRAHPGLGLEIDGAALSQYLACLYVPAPATIHAGIRKLPAGHWLRWRNGAVEICEWWRPHLTGHRIPTLDEAVEELMPSLDRAVTDRLVADVEVGCFLSGGIDSSVIAALMARRRKAEGLPPPRTFTMTFDEPAYDERDAARAVSEHCGTHHLELPARPEVAGFINAMVRLFGEPFGNPTALLVNELSRLARQHVTVALVGDGGDEVFGGYPRYQGGLLATRLDRTLPSWLRRGVLAPMASMIPENTSGRHTLRRAREFLSAAGMTQAERYASWVEYFSPEERHAMVGGEWRGRPIATLYRACDSGAPLDTMQQTDLISFLPGNLLAYGDAMSMAHALELRHPLLDHRVLDTVATLAPSLRFAQGMKTLLKAAGRRLLPAEIIDRPKLGFNPPMGRWLKESLRDVVEERLTPESMETCGLAWKPVERLLAEHRRGYRDHSLKVWALLVLEAWRRNV